MMDEIKQRIEQIQRGEVPEGYWKTKAGISPAEWRTTQLLELLNFKNGINAEKEKFGTGKKLISVRDILSEKPIYYDTILGAIEITDKQAEEFGVAYGDILFQRSSENYEDAGTSNVYLDKEKTATFSGFVIRGKKKAEYDPIYLDRLLKTFSVRKEIIRGAAGAQHINIGQNSLEKVAISLASYKEQQKIAAILTTQDKVIELKEKLIAEKQKQKKYLMQQLLTGKKRLKGFSGEWTACYIKNISMYNSISLTVSSVCEQSDREKYPVYGASGVLGYLDYYKNENSYISIIKDGASAGKIQLCQEKSSTIGTLGCIYPKDDVLLKYLYYLLERIDFSKYLNGSTIPHVYYKDYKMEKILLPSFMEQQAIAEVLATADREIELLQKELEQEKQKKKALMQLLLTGIVRVKI